MRNVATRMLMADTAQCVISWKMKVLEMLNQKRGEAVMKRVGLRMLNKDLSISYCNWRDKYVEHKNRLRGEQIMRRVGARMMKKELTTNWDAWVQNKKENISDMVTLILAHVRLAGLLRRTGLHLIAFWCAVAKSSKESGIGAKCVTLPAQLGVTGAFVLGLRLGPCLGSRSRLGYTYGWN